MDLKYFTDYLEISETGGFQKVNHPYPKTDAVHTICKLSYSLVSFIVNDVIVKLKYNRYLKRYELIINGKSEPCATKHNVISRLKQLTEEQNEN